MAIIPAAAKKPAADPIVYLDGGPGADAILDAPSLTDAGLNRDRALVMMSQRGTFSSSSKLTCPEIDQFYAQRVGMVYDAASTGDQYVKAVAACRKRLSATGIDLAAYNSSESAADLADLRTALGIGQWNVFGHSYGTDLALVYMRDHPQGIRSVTLDGVAPPSAVGLAWTWTTAKEAFDNITASCAAQPACQGRYPNLGSTFVAQVNRLEAHPVTTTVTVKGVGQVKVVLDGGALWNWFLRASHAASDFPMAVDELAHGNPQRIATDWASARVSPPGTTSTFAHGLSLSVWCSEWVPFESDADVLRAGQSTFPAFPASVQTQAPQLAFLRQACQAWNVPKAPSSIRAVTNSAIPTLVLSGSYDAQTAPQWELYAARTLTRATELTVPGMPHGVYENPCAASVVVSFLDNPQAPDTRCVASVHAPAFTTTSGGPPHS